MSEKERCELDYREAKIRLRLAGIALNSNRETQRRIGWLLIDLDKPVFPLTLPEWDRVKS